MDYLVTQFLFNPLLHLNHAQVGSQFESLTL